MESDEIDGAFDRLVGELVAPLVVVTTGGGARGQERAGCLVGFHGQCGIAPRRYAVWLSKANRTYQVGRDSEIFAVHLLDRTHAPVAELFGAETGDEVDKFARCAWTPGPGGVPLLEACPNRLVGRRTTLADVGADHVCVVLEPVAVEHPGLGPSLAVADVAGMVPGHRADDPPHP